MPFYFIFILNVYYNQTVDCKRVRTFVNAIVKKLLTMPAGNNMKEKVKYK